LESKKSTYRRKPQPISYRGGGFGEGMFCAVGIGSATLGHVARATAACAEPLKGLLHERAHVIG
jgi:hypothetical protein